MECPICNNEVHGSTRILTQERSGKKECNLFNCVNCGLFFLEDYKEDRIELYDEDYAVWGKATEENEEIVSMSKKETFKDELKLLRSFVNPKGKKLLDLGTGKGYLLEVAKGEGFDCWGLEISEYAAIDAQKRFPGRIFCGTIESAAYPDSMFDVITMADYIEHVQNPSALFEELRRILVPGGIIFAITPDTDSLMRKIMGKNWLEYKQEHVTYWNRKSAVNALDKFGFETLGIGKHWKKFNLGYCVNYFDKYAFFGMEKMIAKILRNLPPGLQKLAVKNYLNNELYFIARKR